MNKLYGFLTGVFLLFFVHHSVCQIVINEYSCANFTSGGYADSFGNMDDWVELYNTTGTSIDLNGYFLSDKGGSPLFPTLSPEIMSLITIKNLNNNTPPINIDVQGLFDTNNGMVHLMVKKPVLVFMFIN